MFGTVVLLILALSLHEGAARFLRLQGPYRAEAMRESITRLPVVQIREPRPLKGISSWLRSFSLPYVGNLIRALKARPMPGIVNDFTILGR